MRRWAVCGAVVLTSLLPAVVPAWAAESGSEPARRYLNGMKRLGLGQLLGQYCRQMLASPDLDTALQADLTVDLASQVSYRATRTLDAEKRRAGWEEANALITQFLEKHPKYGGGEVIRYRWAGQLLARCQFTAKLSTALPDDAALAEDTLNVARSAVETMIALRETVAEQVNNTGARRARGGRCLVRRQAGQLGDRVGLSSG